MCEEFPQSDEKILFGIFYQCAMHRKGMKIFRPHDALVLFSLGWRQPLLLVREQKTVMSSKNDASCSLKSPVEMRWNDGLSFAGRDNDFILGFSGPIPRHLFNRNFDTENHPICWLLIKSASRLADFLNPSLYKAIDVTFVSLSISPF